MKKKKQFAASEWRNPETAPRDGTAILGYFGDTAIHACYSTEYQAWVRWPDGDDVIYPKLVAWAELYPPEEL